MTAADHVAAMGRLYGPDAHELARQLPDLADSIHAQLCALYVAPSESGAEDMARNLHGLRAHVLRLADAIRREGRE